MATDGSSNLRYEPVEYPEGAHVFSDVIARTIFAPPDLVTGLSRDLLLGASRGVVVALEGKDALSVSMGGSGGSDVQLRTLGGARLSVVAHASRTG